MREEYPLSEHQKRQKVGALQRKRARRRKQMVARSSKKQKDYTKYLLSVEWRTFRMKVLSTRGTLCEECKVFGRRVEVHHLTYERVGAELPEDVAVLCNSCHVKHHTRKAKPHTPEHVG